jgi:hypothetical protein
VGRVIRGATGESRSPAESTEGSREHAGGSGVSANEGSARYQEQRRPEDALTRELPYAYQRRVAGSVGKHVHSQHRALESPYADEDEPADASQRQVAKGNSYVPSCPRAEDVRDASLKLASAQSTLRVVSLELRQRSLTVHIGETERRGCGSPAASKHTMSIAGSFQAVAVCRTRNHVRTVASLQSSRDARARRSPARLPALSSATR